MSDTKATGQVDHIEDEGEPIQLFIIQVKLTPVISTPL